MPVAEKDTKVLERLENCAAVQEKGPRRSEKLPTHLPPFSHIQAIQQDHHYRASITA